MKTLACAFVCAIALSGCGILGIRGFGSEPSGILRGYDGTRVAAKTCEPQKPPLVRGNSPEIADSAKKRERARAIFESIQAMKGRE